MNFVLVSLNRNSTFWISAADWDQDAILQTLCRSQTNSSPVIPSLPLSKTTSTHTHLTTPSFWISQSQDILYFNFIAWCMHKLSQIQSATLYPANLSQFTSQTYWSTTAIVIQFTLKTNFRPHLMQLKQKFSRCRNE
jgi:hypothetical protein